MTPRQMQEAVRSLCKALAVRHAVMRERYIGNEERLTDPWAQLQAALLLSDIRDRWRREKKSIGL